MPVTSKTCGNLKRTVAFFPAMSVRIIFDPSDLYVEKYRYLQIENEPH